MASGYGAGEEMRAALQGAHTLFLVPAAEAPDRVDQHRAAVDAAAAAGVQRIVYLSFLRAAPDATFTLARDHWHTEQHVRAAGPAWTFLRMSLYLDFIPSMAGPDGVIRGPAGDGRVAAVLRDDVAAAAAPVLTSEGHDGPDLRADRPGGLHAGPGRGGDRTRDRAGRSLPRRDRRGGVRVTGGIGRTGLGGTRVGQLLPGHPRRQPGRDQRRRGDPDRATGAGPRGPAGRVNAEPGDVPQKGMRPAPQGATAPGARGTISTAAVRTRSAQWYEAVPHSEGATAPRACLAGRPAHRSAPG